MDADPVVADDVVVDDVEVPNPIHDILVTCGIAAIAHSNTFINIEGLDSVAAFASMNGDADVTEMAKRMASRPTNAAGRVILGTMQIKRLQALVYWIKDYDKRGMQAEPGMWNAETMTAAMERKESEYNYGKIDVDIIDPGKCQTDFGWDNWQIAFVNKLNATMGAAKVPVDYIVRPEWDEDDELFMTDDETRKYQMPLTGENFKRDNKLVYQMLKSACVKSDAWTWIQSFDRATDGRKAWLALVNHYDGTGELSKRVERAKEEIARLHYKDEKVFPFEKYVTKLKENFSVLEKDKHEGLTGKQQVDVLLRGIKSTDPGIASAKINVFQSYRGDFDGAVDFLSSLIANIHAAAQLDYSNRNAGNKRRYVGAMGSNDQRGGRGRARQGGGRYGQRGGRGGGRGRDGRGRGRNSDRRTYANNVDITDPHRNFTSEEWDKLGTMRSYVIQLREGGRGGGRGRSDRSHDDNRTAGSVAATNTTQTTGAQGTAANNTTDQSVVSDITERGSQNGRGFGRGAYNNN